MAKKKVKKKSSAATHCTDGASFEETLTALEKIVFELESGELGLTEALERYEKGVAHLKTCQQQLTSAERKIEILSGVDASGNPITEPFADAGDESLTEKAAARGQRRTRSASKRSSEGDDDELDVDSLPRLF